VLIAQHLGLTAASTNLYLLPCNPLQFNFTMSYEPKHDLEQAQSPYKKNELDLEPQETHRRGSVFSTSGRRMSISDEVFGEITEDGPNYRDVRLFATDVCQLSANEHRLVGWELLSS
jgi:hypothetical protein